MKTANMASSTHAQRGLMVFHVGGQACALPLKGVREILHMALLSRPPGLPSVLEGFLNLSGATVPVLRLSRLFNLPEQTPGLYTPLIVLQGLDPPLALLADGVSEVLSVSEEALSPVREGHTFNDCAEAEVIVEGRVVHLLCPERILLERERQRLAEFQAMAQQRLREVEANP